MNFIDHVVLKLLSLCYPEWPWPLIKVTQNWPSIWPSLYASTYQVWTTMPIVSWVIINTRFVKVTPNDHDTFNEGHHKPVEFMLVTCLIIVQILNKFRQIFPDLSDFWNDLLTHSFTDFQLLLTSLLHRNYNSSGQLSSNHHIWRGWVLFIYIGCLHKHIWIVF